MSKDTISVLKMLLDGEVNEDTFHLIISLLLEVELLLPFNDNKIIELVAENKTYLPLFTDEKQINSDFTYTRLDKVKMDIVLRDIFSLGRYYAISINPYSHDFIINKKMIKIIEKYYIK